MNEKLRKLEEVCNECLWLKIQCICHHRKTSVDEDIEEQIKIAKVISIPRPPVREDIYLAIDIERNYQDTNFPRTKDNPRSIGEYILIMEEAMSQARANWYGNVPDKNSLEMLRKVVATGIRCFEDHGIPRRDLNQ